MSKKDRVTSLITLKTRLTPLLDRALELDSIDENSTKHLLQSNKVLREIISEFFKFLTVSQIIEDMPTKQGNKPNDQNQQILEKAFEEYYDNYNREPNEPEWYEWIEQERYNPFIKSIVAANNKFSKTKNGWGKEKARKDLAKFKSIEYKIMKTLAKIHGID